MPVKILMPALSPTMTEGKLAKWLVGEGEEVNSGDVIAEIETDKATMEVEAVEEGKLGKIMVPEGTEGVAVNNVIALLLEEGEDDSVLDGVDVSAAPSGGNGVPRRRSPNRPLRHQAHLRRNLPRPRPPLQRRHLSRRHRASALSPAHWRGVWRLKQVLI